MDKKLYDLTPAENLLFMQRKFSMKKSCLNIPTSMIFETSINEDLLEEALNEAIGRWDCFGLRLVKDGKGYKQYFGERKSLGIIRKDFSKSTNEAMEAFFDKESRKNIGIIETPMARFFIIRTPEGHSGVFSVVSHMIIDSWSITTFYKDVMEIYFHKAEGKPYPKDVRPYEKVLAQELEFSGTPAYQEQKDFWRREYSKGEPIYTHPNGTANHDKFRKKKGNENARYTRTFRIFSKGSHDIHYISADVVKRMQDFIIDKQLPSMAVLYQMAMRLYLGKVNGRQTDVTIYNVLSRRGTLDEKFCGGDRAQNVIARTVMPEEMSFLDGLKLITEQNNEHYRNASFSALEAMALQKEIYNIRLGLSYTSTLVTFQPLPMETEGIKVRTNWYANGSAAIPLYATVMDGDGTGALKCYYEHDDQITSETIARMHDYLIKVLVKGIENPDVTIGELFDL